MLAVFAVLQLPETDNVVLKESIHNKQIKKSLNLVKYLSSFLSGIYICLFILINMTIRQNVHLTATISLKYETYYSSTRFIKI